MLTALSNPIYADPANNSVRCAAQWNGVPTSYLAVNGDPTSQTLFNSLVAGTYGVVAAYVAPTPTLADLRSYAFGHLPLLFAAARSYTLGSGVSVYADATTSTGADLNALLTRFALPSPPTSVPWVDDFGVVTTLSASQVQTLAVLVIAYAQSVYAVLASVMQAIGSGGITTKSQIDSAAWPT